MGPVAKAAIPTLIRALQQDTNDNIRWATAHALARMGQEAVLILIHALQQDTNTDVQRAAAEALGWMRRRGDRAGRPLESCA